jgi:hypothetical protein
MTGDWTCEDLVISSVGSEWPRQSIPALRAYSFAVDRQAKKVWLKAHFDQPFGEDEQAAIWDIEGAVGSQLPDDWQANTEFEVLASAQEPSALAGGFIYRRGDTETPRQRRERRLRHASRP